MAKKVSLKARLQRYAKQSVRKLSERVNRNRLRRLPLEPIHPLSIKIPKKRKTHKDRM